MMVAIAALAELLICQHECIFHVLCTYIAVVPMSKQTPTLVFLLMRIFHRPKIGTTARKMWVKAENTIHTQTISKTI